MSTERRGGPGLTSAPYFDAEAPWRVSPQVAVRPEPFGALLYHFGTRKLSFLKDQRLLRIVRSLEDQPSARSAVAASGVSDSAAQTYISALGTLAASQMVVRREEVS